MELILNNYPDTRNHRYVINDLISGSTKINLAVAFIRASGLTAILDSIIGKDVKIICSLSFGSTDQRSLTTLLDRGFNVKFCKLEQGILHSKIWIFKTNKTAKALIGSANLSVSALEINSETSILVDRNEDEKLVNKLTGYFDYLWFSKSSPVTREIIENLANMNRKQDDIKQVTKKQVLTVTQDKDKYDSIISFIKSWIDIGTEIKIPGETGKLWRGWYIIPDQGMIDDNLMILLRQIIKVIHNYGNSINTRNASHMEDIYKITRTTYSANRSMDERSLFIRQQKNFLVKFGFAYHPLKENGRPDEDILELSDSGIEVSILEEPYLDRYREIYTNNMLIYTYNGFNIVPFVQSLVDDFDYLDFFEFSSFVNHVYSDDKYDLIKELIALYRSCSKITQKSIRDDAKTYFDKVLGPTANNVRGNYDKKIRHQMSVIGWLTGYQYDANNKALSKK